MGAILISALMVIGVVISVVLIKSKWNYYASDPFGFEMRSLLNINILSRVWPTDEKFMSLHFSVFRHMAVGIISVVVMYVFNDGFLAWIIPWVNLIYAFSMVPRYMARKRDWTDCGDATRKTLNPVKKACFVTVIYGFYVYILSMAFYAVRP